FRQRQELYPPVPFDPAKGQSDSLFSDVYDFNGDGWDDVLVRGRVHLHPARWYENPQGERRHWKRHVVFPKIQGENPPFVDVTGDGRPEIVTHWEGFWGYVAPDWSRPHEPWTFVPLGAEGDWPQFHHGQGVGDITGDGLPEIVINEGWLTRDESPTAEGDSAWHFQPYRFSKEGGGAQMLIYDVDGDGDNDVVTALDAHGWGLAWFENVRDKRAPAPSFIQHTFMGSREEESKYGVAFSQPHALGAGDVDGDGLTDVVVGKRRWAHGPSGDIEPNAPAVVYWFRLERTAQGVRFRPHPIDDNSGVGLQIAATDVNADGRIDVLTASKLGTFLFLAKPRRTPADQ
ncbi:MAG: VCBS repeat-containing protein, partial [Thermoguttaceae bacterium]